MTERRRILVVEDSSAMRAFVRATLEDDGTSVVTEASSGLAGLQVLARDTFDVVIVDVNMPDINGLEVVAFIRRSETHKGTPLLIISTEASAKDRERGLSLGANAYLSKPFSPEELRAAVAEIEHAEKESP